MRDLGVNPLNQDRKSSLRQYGMVFGLGILTSLLFFLPFLIWDKGYFVYYGDFNVQQIPFYWMCHDSIRSGNVLWNWYTDMGANFVGSYAFYLLGSPYFWLTMLFPSGAVPYLMAPLLMLKFATASVTGYAYIRRFVREPNYAVIGALLYAFSGYSIYNVFFNHFHEVIAFFPLLLVGMEEFMINGRRGVFAVAVGLCAVVNYYFFFGEVVFCVLYFIIRAVYDRKNPRGFHVTWSRFLLLALEAVLGLLLSAVMLVPGLLAILGNPRTSQFLFGWNGIFYGNVQRYGLIISSFFFPPDIPAYPNFFPDSNAKWSSVSAFLPLFSMTGVLAFFKGRRRHWAKALFGLCCVMALIPFLNSSFSAFNSSYYARWFYMPVLILAAMTVNALEDPAVELDRPAKRIGWLMIATLAFALVPVQDTSTKEWTLGVLQNPGQYAAVLGFGLAGLLVYRFIARRWRQDKRLPQRMLAAVLAFTVVGSYVASLVPSRTMGSFSVLMTMLLGIKFIIRPVMTTREAMQNVSKKKRMVQSIVCGAFIGMICGFVGAGGGMMMLLILTSVMGYELKTAVGTSVFIMAFTALTGAVSHFTIGGLPDGWTLALCMAFTLLFAQIAAKIANKSKPETLNRVVGVVLLVLGVVILAVQYLK